ncbi:hypothetical protein [Trebonia sp.]|uniref:hypothetical protein n=1 Tax=Trebonia sp. TaxID=2767075 RepID=UPI003BB01B15
MRLTGPRRADHRLGARGAKGAGVTYDANISHSGARPDPSSEGLDWPVDQRLLKVEPTVLHIAAKPDLTCCDASSFWTSPRIRQAAHYSTAWMSV